MTSVGNIYNIQQYLAIGCDGIRISRARGRIGTRDKAHRVKYVYIEAVTI
ncbi:MAG: hypothetical protein ACTSRK_16365 [Promethearchaeota archaeon]